MSKISVIIPVYNTEKYLGKCLESVCNQTLSDIEIICVNDCSPDGSLEILKKYACKDDRVKIIDFKENKGAAAARNAGMEVANGEYIGFVDSDDWVDSDFYEKLYNAAVKFDADVAKGDIYDFNENSREDVLTEFYNKNDKIRNNKAYFCYGFTSAIYKKVLIAKNKIEFPEGITYFEDPYFSILVSIFAKNVQVVDEAKYHYIRHSDSACHNCKNERATKDFIYAIELIYNILNKNNLSEEDYGIYVAFLLEQLIPWCSDFRIPEFANIQAIKALSTLFENSKFKIDTFLIKYFLNKRELSCKEYKKRNAELIKNLRTNLRRK